MIAATIVTTAQRASRSLLGVRLQRSTRSKLSPPFIIANMAAHTVPRGTRCLFVGFLLVMSTVASAATRGICPQPATPAALSSHAAIVQDAIAKLNATVHASIAASQGLGGYVVVVAGQDVMFQSGYGTTRRSGGHTPNENTGFRVGSVTKVRTANVAEANALC